MELRSRLSSGIRKEGGQEEGSYRRVSFLIIVGSIYWSSYAIAVYSLLSEGVKNMCWSNINVNRHLRRMSRRCRRRGIWEEWKMKRRKNMGGLEDEEEEEYGRRMYGAGLIRGGI